MLYAVHLVMHNHNSDRDGLYQPFWDFEPATMI